MQLMRQRMWIMIIGLLGFIFMPSTCSAYNADVHFNLTYVLCRLHGLSEPDALWIAAADESMDTNFSTTAFSSIWDTLAQELHIKPKVWVRNGTYWHAFTRAGASTGFINSGWQTIRYFDPSAARNAVIARRDELWTSVQTAVSTQNSPDGRIRSDIAMGQFLHYDQDFYAHRQLTHYLNEDQWLPYGPVQGHSADGHIPDYVARRPDLAQEMIREVDGYIRRFSTCLHTESHTAQPSYRTLDRLIAALAQSTEKPQNVINHTLMLALKQSSEPGFSWFTIPILTPKYHLPYDTPQVQLGTVLKQMGIAHQASTSKRTFSEVLMPQFLQERDIIQPPRVHCFFCH